MSYTPIYDHLKKTFTYPPFVPKTLPPDYSDPKVLNKYHEEQAAMDEQKETKPIKKSSRKKE